ncbi:cation diffusion facilitator family transporter [Pseudomonas sp. N040]|uniref:cation diffusion facilitator family transporter n=1 Tax=Pseudomonas sp. N040 TaxID=2785325 RepID=UPI0018A316EC|nr:cation diffusion facilitator family transporter [Pseudomonas sp. N040]MBF7731082.1 cation transporter [Pseudomonas sp. N040]MBW7014725.1 cation diffusion facilitator family transporter [Pseudomonas sp. N040]
MTDESSHSHAGHAHAHGHNHSHSHAPANFNRAFAIGVALNVGFVLIEALFGLLANSLALLADAGHNLSDVLGLLLAWGASVLVQKAPTQRHTYGLRRSSVLAALFNALLLLLAVAAIAWEALLRFNDPQPIAGGTVIVVAAIGIAINGYTAWLFMSGKDGDVNIRSAYLHMAADAAISLGVVLAAIAMLATGWLWLDPAASMAISLVIAISTWGLLRESLNLALDAVPGHIQPAKVQAYLESLPGVAEVHDLHIWAMSTTEVALTAHLIKPDAALDDALLARINQELHTQFDIQHTTLQFERGDSAFPCRQAPAGSV